MARKLGLEEGEEVKDKEGNRSLVLSFLGWSLIKICRSLFGGKDLEVSFGFLGSPWLDGLILVKICEDESCLAYASF